MKKNIHNISEDSMTNSITGLVNCFDKMNLTPEQIVEHIEDMNLLARTGMHIIALSNGNKTLADKIAKANELIKLKRVEAFKKSVANGTDEEFLANMTHLDKSSLQVDMGLFRIGIKSENPLTEVEQQYYDIIQNSIDDDLETEALSQGFDSVDSWRSYNKLQSMGIEPQIETDIPNNVKKR